MTIYHGDRWNPISVITDDAYPWDQTNHFNRGTNDVEPGAMDCLRDQWTSSGTKLSWKTINNCFTSNDTFAACDGSRHGIRVGDNRYTGERTIPLNTVLPLTGSTTYHTFKPHLSYRTDVKLITFLGAPVFFQKPLLGVKKNPKQTLLYYVMSQVNSWLETVTSWVLFWFPEISTTIHNPPYKTQLYIYFSVYRWHKDIY